MTDIAATLAAALGPDAVAAGEAVPEGHRADWSGQPPALPRALVRPRTTEEVSTVLRLCHAAGVGVVPQGGLTGLCGGAHPRPDCVALSTSRMRRIESVDPDAGTLTAEAGVPLEAAQQAAAEAGMQLGIDIGSRGSCTLGGIVSTNAGGNTVIRHGMTRAHVLGLEAVLADGTVIPAMNTLLKNNVGLDTKQLFIGTEGVLGIVTRVVLRLGPKPVDSATAFVGLGGTEAAIALLGRARAGLGPMLTAFEVMWPSFHDEMAERAALPHPLAGRHGAYALVEAEAFRPGAAREALETCLGAALEAGVVEDAVLASSLADARALWAVRETPGRYDRLFGTYIGFDIGLPVARMAAAVGELEAAVRARWPEALAMSYGHIGDGNLHLVVHVPPARSAQPTEAVSAMVYDRVRDMGGTISAEHGIGTLRRAYMGHSRSAADLAAMRTVKAALDPRGILNPGRSFAPDAAG